MPTVNQFRPEKAHDIYKEKVLADFIALQDELLSIVQKAQQEELDLERIKTKNPIVKFVPMSVVACLGATEAHQRRHFEQMRELKERFS